MYFLESFTPTTSSKCFLNILKLTAGSNVVPDLEITIIPNFWSPSSANLEAIKLELML